MQVERCRHHHIAAARHQHLRRRRWTHALVADGRYDNARFGSGVYGSDLTKVGKLTLEVNPAGKIIACPSFVGPYRGGGGARSWTHATESHDTDTADSNAFDLITGDVSQREVRDWTKGPVVAPYVQLTR